MVYPPTCFDGWVFGTRACLKITFKPSNCTKIILLWQIPNVLPKGSCLGALVLKPRFLGLYAPLRIPSKRERAAIGKILELPEPILVDYSIFKHPLVLWFQIVLLYLLLFHTKQVLTLQALQVTCILPHCNM